MKRKGFTLVELLVVIAIIALLMGILMPALARVRQLAFRMTCGTNLSGIGKAMLIYANDYEDELPRAGGRSSTWGQVANWMAPDRYSAFTLAADGTGGKATISSCFYLLVKYAEVTPKSFVCKSDAGTTEFKLTDLTAAVPTNFELIDAWDFGPMADAYKHCSYAYHVPFGLYALTTSSEPGFAVAADRNPFIKSPAADAAPIGNFKPDLDAYKFTGAAGDTAHITAVATSGPINTMIYIYPPSGPPIVATTSDVVNHVLTVSGQHTILIEDSGLNEAGGYLLTYEGPGDPAGAPSVEEAFDRTRVVLRSPYPNPFTRTATVAFSIPAERSVRLRVFDASGALVRTLADAALAAGRHQFEWDGRNDHGRFAASGVYYLELQTGAETTRRQLVRVR